jgi:hypothetical protein
MKFGKLVLGVAAAIVTIGSAFSARVAHRFGSNLIYAKTAVSSRNCKACRNFFTGSGFLFERCKTSNGIHTLFGTIYGGKVYAFTKLTEFFSLKCGGNKVTRVSEDE